MDSTPAARSSRLAGSVAVGFATLLFSWGFIFAKVIGLPAPMIASLRLVVAGLVLSLVALVFRVRWVQVRGVVALAGLAFGMHQLLYISAVQRTSVAVVALAGATMPLLVALVSRRTVGETVPRALVGCAVLAIAGVAIVLHGNLESASRSLLGDLLALANVLASTLYFLSAKKARLADAPTLTLTATIFWIALFVTLPAMLLTELEAPDATQWTWVVLLALGPGNGHLLVNWAHRRISAALAALVLSMLPGLATLWAYLLLNEPFTWWTGVGLVLVTLSVEIGRRVDQKAALAA
jgi:drug/metabolite transporter (DMT)-like permease